MKSFKDTAGRTWTIAVNIDSIKRVRALCSLDLMSAVDGSLFTKLAADPILLCDTIYAICKPEADAANVSDSDFGKAMGGDAIEQASEALLQEICDFFPKGRRGILTKANQKLQAAEAIGCQMAGAKIDAMDVNALMQKALGDSAISLPAASASTPAPSPSESLPG